MRILIVTCVDPTNFQSGIGLIVGNILKSLSKVSGINLSVIVVSGEKREGIVERVVALGQNRNINVLGPIFRVGVPGIVRRSILGAAILPEEEKVLEMVAHHSKLHDVAIWFGSGWDPLSKKMPGACACPVIHYMIDSIAKFEQNRPLSLTRWMRSLIASNQERKILNSGFAKTIYVSESDANMGKHLVSRKRASDISVIPNGVDVEKFSVRNRSLNIRPEVPVLLFTGVMEYLPNVDAAITLVRKVLPNLKHTVNVRIVGMRPAPQVLALGATLGVIVTGAVEDIVAEYQKADLFVVPMMSGTGFKNKIIEAMSCGLPVVSTAHALGGFPSLPPGVIVANTWETMATEIDCLLDNNVRLVDMGRDASRYVMENYTWDKSAAKLLQLISCFV